MKKHKNVTTQQPELSIIIPAYSEEGRIGDTLDGLSIFLNSDQFFRTKGVEVIVVVADSPDRTADIVKEKSELFMNLRLLQPGKRRGKGRDVQFGMLRATGKYIVFMDADLATPLRYLREFYSLCEAGNDLVIGTRNLARHHHNIIRRSISIIGNILFRLVCGLWIEDSQCGFKMFNENARSICFSKMKILGWSFDMEILTIAHVNHLKIKCIRINDWRDVPNGTFNEGIVRLSLRSMRDLGHILKNKLSGLYMVDLEDQPGRLRS